MGCRWLVQSKREFGFYCKEVEGKIKKRRVHHQSQVGYMRADVQRWVWRFGPGYSPR